MATPKVVLTADRTLMSPYRGISLATFFGCAPAIDPNRDKNSFWYKILKEKLRLDCYVMDMLEKM